MTNTPFLCSQIVKFLCFSPRSVLFRTHDKGHRLELNKYLLLFQSRHFSGNNGRIGNKWMQEGKLLSVFNKIVQKHFYESSLNFFLLLWCNQQFLSLLCNDEKQRKGLWGSQKELWMRSLSGARSTRRAPERIRWRSRLGERVWAARRRRETMFWDLRYFWGIWGLFA